MQRTSRPGTPDSVRAFTGCHAVIRVVVDTTDSLTATLLSLNSLSTQDACSSHEEAHMKKLT
jgi:hypothetical protein